MVLVMLNCIPNVGNHPVLAAWEDDLDVHLNLLSESSNREAGAEAIVNLSLGKRFIGCLFWMVFKESLLLLMIQ